MTPQDVFNFWPSQSEFQDSTGFTPAARRQWRKTGSIPYRSQVQLQIASRNKLKAERESK